MASTWSQLEAQEAQKSKERDDLDNNEKSEMESFRKAMDDELTNLKNSSSLQKELSGDLQQAINKLEIEIQTLRGKQKDFQLSTEKKCSSNMTDIDSQRQQLLEKIDRSDQINNTDLFCGNT